MCCGNWRVRRKSTAQRIAREQEPSGSCFLLASRSISHVVIRSTFRRCHPAATSPRLSSRSVFYSFVIPQRLPLCLSSLSAAEGSACVPAHRTLYQRAVMHGCSRFARTGANLWPLAWNRRVYQQADPSASLRDDNVRRYCGTATCAKCCGMTKQRVGGMSAGRWMANYTSQSHE